ncbi:60S ribosomal protein L17-2-like protein [Tanacetum coccineum]
MDNNGRDHVVYSLVQRDGQVRHRRLHEKRVLVGADEHEIGDEYLIDGYLTAKEQQQLLLDEETLRETLEEETRVEKEWEERIKQEQAHDELFSYGRTCEVADQFKSLPSGGNVEAGEIPSLADLGINHTANMSRGWNENLLKNTYETAHALRKMSLIKAKRYLEDVLVHKQAIPFTCFCRGVGRTAQAKNRHSNGQGRWPAKSAKFILDLLKNAESVTPPDGAWTEYVSEGVTSS